MRVARPGLAVDYHAMEGLPYTAFFHDLLKGRWIGNGLNLDWIGKGRVWIYWDWFWVGMWNERFFWMF